MRTRLWTFLTIGLLALPLGAVQAQDAPGDSATEAERLAAEALAKLLQALNLLIESVPQYAAPEVLPNGDIILRRLNPKKEPDEPVETEGEDGVDT